MMEVDEPMMPLGDTHPTVEAGVQKVEETLSEVRLLRTGRVGLGPSIS